MTEILTEKWKNEQLDVLFDVYVKIPDEGVCIKKIYYLNQYLGTKLADEIEVLAPVPTYKEFFVDKKFIKDLGRDYSELMNQKVELLEKIEKLEKQLNIATKALREYSDENSWVDCKTVDDDFEYIERKCAWYVDGYKTAQKALKEIDEVLK